MENEGENEIESYFKNTGFLKPIEVFKIVSLFSIATYLYYYTHSPQYAAIPLGILFLLLVAPLFKQPNWRTSFVWVLFGFTLLPYISMPGPKEVEFLKNTKNSYEFLIFKNFKDLIVEYSFYVKSPSVFLSNFYYSNNKFEYFVGVEKPRFSLAELAERELKLGKDIIQILEHKVWAINRLKKGGGETIFSFDVVKYGEHYVKNIKKIYINGERNYLKNEQVTDSLKQRLLLRCEEVSQLIKKINQNS